MSGEIPAVIDDLSSGCVRAVREALGFELDYTGDTLPVLDHWIALAETRAGAVLDLLVSMAGAYFGEVVRRAIPTARWHAPPDDPARWRIELEDVFLCVNPAAMAREALTRAETEGWNASLRLDEGDRRALAETLSALGEVDEDDYHRFTVRFEVLETAVEALRSRARTRKGTPPRFGPELYAAAYDPTVPPTFS